MLHKRKAYKRCIKFERSPIIDLEKTVCEFYGCLNRSSRGEININNSICQICDILRRKIALSDEIYYIPSDDCEKV